MVNFDAGAETQAASIFAAIGIALTAAFLTPVLYYLPKVTLAATIIVAVLSLVDFSIFKRAWQVNRSDFFAVLITVLVTLFFGVELGVACGVIASIGLHLYRTSQPHIAEVGLVEGTEHFRNILRHSVQCKPNLLSLRMDQSLLFTNASYLEDLVYEKIAGRGELSDLVLMFSAVNEVDLSAIDALTSMNRQLRESGIKLHLSEVKGPVMDTLERTKVLEHLSGRVFLSQFDAYQQLGSGSEVATEAAATETKQPSLTNS